MSFLPINEENKEAPVGQTTNAPSTAPPQVSGSAGGAPSTPKGASTGSPTQFGSSASKLGDYLSANAPQITEQANTLAGNLNQQYGQVSQGITNAANQFGQQVQGGYAPGNPDVITQAMQNPTDFASNPENVKAFQGQYNNAYTGPLTFEGTTPYSDIQNQVSQAVTQGNLLNTPAGLQSYLQGQGPNPTNASSTLDALLLQGSPNALSTIQNAVKPYSSLPGQLQSATTSADQSVQDALKTVAAAQQNRARFDPFVQQFGGSLTDQLAAANANRNTYNQAITQNQANAQDYQAQLLQAQQDAINKYTGNVKNIAGNPQAGELELQRIAGLINPQAQLAGLQSYLSGQPLVQPATLENVATAPQFAEDAALAQLLGSAYAPVLNPFKAGQAGTFNVPQVPGATPNPSGEIQYMGDIASLYGTPYGITNANAPGGWNNPNPIPVAQAVLNQSQNVGQGVNLDAATRAALQRLVANQYAGR